VPPGNWNHVRVLLLDIEGTTTPIDFVYKTLFPYAARNVEPFLRAHFSEREVDALIQDLKAQHGRDDAAGPEPAAWLSGSDDEQLSSCVAYARWLIARDSKCTPLKTLQGKIWQQGFGNGELHGEVYPDVPPAFERWRRQQRQICIYSSGSVLAQQQLFQSFHRGVFRHSHGVQDGTAKLHENRRGSEPFAAGILIRFRRRKRSGGCALR
jgi:enolase-phosphatase E1